MRSLRIAYTIQNVGGIDLASDLGDTVPVKHTLRGLMRSGHAVKCLILDGQDVVSIDDVTRLNESDRAPLGWIDARPFLALEGGVRRLQRELGLPYFAVFDNLRFYEACRRNLQEFDICHEHNGIFSAGTALACSRIGLPYILTFSADPIFELDLADKPLRGIHRAVAIRVAYLTYRLARRIICVSESAKRQLTESWSIDPGKIVVMPNGVDVEFFRPLQSDNGIRAELSLPEAPIVGWVGGFHRWHGLDFLVESFVHVLTEIPQAKLLLVGDGPTRSEVQRKIRDLGIKDSVIMTGLVPHEKVARILAALDVAVVPYPRLPSEMWFSPLKLFEYMSAGKPIVATKAGQIAEVIENGRSGLLVNQEDAHGFAEAVIALLKDPQKRLELGSNARRHAVERHSWGGYIQRLESVYVDVLREAGRDADWRMPANQPAR